MLHKISTETTMQYNKLHGCRLDRCMGIKFMLHMIMCMFQIACSTNGFLVYEQIGTIVFLKSLGNPNKNVALGTLQSTDPEYKVEGVRLGNQFWAVRIDATLAKSDPLIRPLKKVNIIGHAAGLIIAWPSTFVCSSFFNFTTLSLVFSTITC